MDDSVCLINFPQVALQGCLSLGCWETHSRGVFGPCGSPLVMRALLSLLNQRASLGHTLPAVTTPVRRFADAFEEVEQESNWEEVDLQQSIQQNSKKEPASKCNENDVQAVGVQDVLKNDIWDLSTSPIIINSIAAQNHGAICLAESSPITRVLEQSVRGLGFTRRDIERLTKMQLPRSDMMQKIIDLWRNWYWRELEVRDVVMRCPHLLKKDPLSLMRNMEILEQKWGREKSIEVVKRSSEVLTGDVEYLMESEVPIKDYLKQRLGVELPAFESTLGTVVYSLSPERVRQKVDSLLEFLPKWCLRKMFARTRSTWFKQGITKMENIYGILVLEILVPTLGDGAEEAAHVMLSRDPNLLNMNPDVLLLRFDLLVNGWFREAATDIVISRPRFLMECPKTLLRRWRHLLLWANANPRWLVQLKNMHPECVATALTYGKKVVSRLHYLATFSLCMNRNIMRILQMPSEAFNKHHPPFERWFAYMHSTPSSTPSSDWSFFEKILRQQWKAFGKLAVKPRRLFIPNLPTWVGILSKYGLSKEAVIRVVRPALFSRDPSGTSCRKLLRLLTEILGTPLDVGRMVYKYHWVLFQSFNGVDEKIKWLRKIGLTPGDIQTMLRRYPHLLRSCLGDQMAEQKLKFLTDHMGRNLKEVVDFPNYWGMSLENRLRPRYDFVAQSSTLTGLPIREIFGRTDRELCRRIRRPLEEYQAFLSERGLAR